MNYRFHYLHIIFLLFILLSSCTPVRYGSIYIEEGLDEEFRKITEEISSYSELEKIIKFTEKGSNQYDRALSRETLLKISLTSCYSFDKDESCENNKTATVRRDLHIPVTDFRDIVSDAGINEIAEGIYRTDIPENIKFPEKGLSFNSLYPDNRNYSLYRETRLTVAIPEKTSKKQRMLIDNWLKETDIERHITVTGNQKSKSASEPGTESDRLSESTGADETGNTFGRITWLGAVGDIMPARGVQDILISKDKGKEVIFSDTLPVLQGFDLLLGNLEGPVTYHKAAIEKAYNFKFRHKVLGELKKAGFDYLSAVNNHCYDFEEQGFLDTLYNLERYKIKTSGGGKNLKEALKPAVINTNGNIFRILALADYPAEKDKFEGRKETEASPEKAGILWPSETVFNAVKKMSSEEGVSIVSVHGGYEWQNQPALKQKKLYRKLADLGADIVIGSHPHVLQPVENWKDSLIVYSLGNFIFPGMDETEFGEESMILSLGFHEGKILYINYIPVNMDMKYLSIDRSGKILKRFSQLNDVFTEKN